MALAAGLLLAAAPGCAGGLPGTPPRALDRTDREAARAPASRVVVLVSVDGLAPWVLDGTETPVLDRLAREGLVAERAETVVPSVTLPSHASMISGVEPDRHGVDWNRWYPWRTVEVATVFTHCRKAALRCGLFAGKPKFAHFAVEEAGVELYAFAEGAERVLDRAEDYVEDREPDFVMIHLAEVDLLGHRDGWGSEAQREAIRMIDDALGEFVEEVAGELSRPVTLIVTADHGGHGTRHGSDDPRDVRIPWIAWGDGVPAGGRIPVAHTVDTAPTVLRLLGQSVPAHWTGRSRFPFAPVGYAEAGAGDEPADASASGGGQ